MHQAGTFAEICMATEYPVEHFLIGRHDTFKKPSLLYWLLKFWEIQYLDCAPYHLIILSLKILDSLFGEPRNLQISIV